MKLEKKMIYSKRLATEVSLDIYEDAEKKIVSTTSLKNLMEDIREERGLTTSYTMDVTHDEAGVIRWVAVHMTMTDGYGFSGMFLGESTAESRLSDIAKQYPAKTAYNRALSCAMIAYLNIPGKIYSDTEVEITEGEYKKKNQTAAKSGLKSKVSEVHEKSKAMHSNQMAQSQGKDATGELMTSIESLPAKPSQTPTQDAAERVSEKDETIEALVMSDNTIEAAPSMIFEVPMLETEFNELDELEEIASTAKAENTKEAVEIDINRETVAATPSDAANEEPEEAIESPEGTEENAIVPGDTLIGMGIFANTTIDDLFEEAKTKDQAKKFIDMAKSGAISVQDVEKKKIIEEIARRSTSV